MNSDWPSRSLAEFLCQEGAQRGRTRLRGAALWGARGLCNACDAENLLPLLCFGDVAALHLPVPWQITPRGTWLVLRRARL